MGQPLANLEGPLVIGTILKELSFKMTPGIEVGADWDLTLKARGFLIDVE